MSTPSTPLLRTGDQATPLLTPVSAHDQRVRLKPLQPDCARAEVAVTPKVGVPIPWSLLKLLEVSGQFAPIELSSTEQAIWASESRSGAAEHLPSSSLLPAGSEAGRKLLLSVI